MPTEFIRQCFAAERRHSCARVIGSLGFAVATHHESVIATARKPDQLQDLVAKHGERVLPLALDVTDNDAVIKAVRAGHERFGRIDVVVNNAGYGDIAAIEDVTVESFRAQFETNFYGVVYVTKAVRPTQGRRSDRDLGGSGRRTATAPSRAGSGHLRRPGSRGARGVRQEVARRQRIDGREKT